MMRAPSDPSAVVRTLIAALPDACLRDLCLHLALTSLATPPPATSPVELSVRRKGGWPSGRPRKTATNGRRRGTGTPAKNTDPKLAARRKRYEAKRAAARQAAKATKVAAKPNGNGEGAAVSPQAFWQHAEKIEPLKPWLAVIREFDIKEAVAQHAYRNQSLPREIGPMAVSKFLTLPVS
jgi:hypothetical protein